MEIKMLRLILTIINFEEMVLIFDKQVKHMHRILKQRVERLNEQMLYEMLVDHVGERYWLEED
jgi:hypothetical protein